MKIIEIVAISALAGWVSAAVVPVLDKQQKPHSYLTRSTQGFSGDMTFYDASVGLGSCGTQGENNQMLVALAADVMQNGQDSNDNPKCFKKINISYKGKTHQGMIVDTCPECKGGSIDVTEALFEKFAPAVVGRLHGVKWSYA